MSAPREAVIEKYFCDQADKLGIFNRKLSWYGRRFAPDRLVMKGGVVMFVEFKSKRGRLSAGQRSEIAELRGHGGLVHVINNKADVDVFFKTLVRLTSRSSGPKIP